MTQNYYKPNPLTMSLTQKKDKYEEIKSESKKELKHENETNKTKEKQTEQKQ